jgi:hypothetical protein
MMVEEPITIQGRVLSGADLELIRRMIQEEPDLHRKALSQRLCQLWNWRAANGQIKDMACRTMLLKLERRGLLTLPPRRRESNNERRGLSRQLQLNFDDDTPITGALSCLEPIALHTVTTDAADAALFAELLRRHHYLGYRVTVGENMKYLARDGAGRPLGCLLFGAAAWKCAPRDRWIGWTHPQRSASLTRLTNNTRFLILPWVRVPHLASRLLGLVARRLNHDWQRRYGHTIALLETFVDTSRFQGVCYRAAGWQCLGQTTGRTRQDRYNNICEPPKLIFARPLLRHWRDDLLAVNAPADRPPDAETT